MLWLSSCADPWSITSIVVGQPHPSPNPAPNPICRPAGRTNIPAVLGVLESKAALRGSAGSKGIFSLFSLSLFQVDLSVTSFGKCAKSSRAPPSPCSCCAPALLSIRTRCEIPVPKMREFFLFLNAGFEQEWDSFGQRCRERPQIHETQQFQILGGLEVGVGESHVAPLVCS